MRTSPVVLASLILLSLGFTACAGRPSMDDALKAIRRGMSTDQVGDLLGEPDRVYDLKHLQPPSVLWGPGVLSREPVWAYDWPHGAGRKILVLRFHGNALVSYKVRAD